MADVKQNPTVKRVGLLEKLRSLAMIELFFTNVTATKDKEGKFIAILQLAKPIQSVRGSQTVQVSTGSVGVSATDVREIKVHQEDMVEFNEATGEGFSFEAEGTGGSYKGSALMLDVTKTREVWLKKTSFAQQGQAYRTTLQNQKLEDLFAPKATSKPNDGEPKEVI